MTEDAIFDPRIFHGGNQGPSQIVIRIGTEYGFRLYYQTKNRTEICEYSERKFSLWYFGIRLGLAEFNAGALRFTEDSESYGLSAPTLKEIVECLEAIESYVSAQAVLS